MSAYFLVRSATAATAVCVCLSTVPSHADEFSWQLAGGATRQEAQGSDLHADTALLSATYYVDPIDDSDAPLALASFFHPTTRLSMEASDASTGNDPKAYSIGGRYVLPGARWYTGAEYSYTDVNLPTGAFVEQSDPKGYRLVGGHYFGATTTLELGVGKSKQKSRFPDFCAPVPSPGCSGPVTFESKTTDWSLDALHVGKLRSLTYSVGGGVRQSDIDVDVTFASGPPTVPVVSADNSRLRTYSVSGELFPTARLGVGLSYSEPDVEGFDVDSYGLSATWFFTRRVAVELSLGRATTNTGSGPTLRSENTALSFIGRL
jgi:hypothetical protein